MGDQQLMGGEVDRLEMVVVPLSFFFFWGMAPSVCAWRHRPLSSFWNGERERLRRKAIKSPPFLWNLVKSLCSHLNSYRLFVSFPSGLLMSIHIATTGAIAFSGATVILCLIGLIGIYNDLQDIWNELDFEMDQFKLQAITPLPMECIW